MDDKITTLDTLLLHATHDAHFIERYLAERLPAILHECGHDSLAYATNRYLDAARDNLDRTEQMLKSLSSRPGNAKSMAMIGLVDQVEDLIEGIEAQPVKDIAIGAAICAVEGFERWRHSSIRRWAEQVGAEDVVSLVDRNLAELDGVREALDVADATLAREQTAAISHGERKRA